jgi:hypothetical protein
MGFHDEYLKRWFKGDLTGPPKNFEQSIAYNAAERDRNPHKYYQNPPSTDTGGGIDLEARFSKRAIFGSLCYGIAAILVGLTLDEFFAGLVGFIGASMTVVGCLMLVGFTFMLLANLFKAGLSGIVGLFSQGWFWRGMSIGVFSGATIALISTSASGFFFGMLLGIGIYAAYKIIRHNNQRTD